MYSYKKSLYRICVFYLFIYRIMKKTTLLFALPLVVLVAWCWSNKIDITDTEFHVESCDKYFELMDCILENDDDETYSDEMRDELRQEVKDMQESWNSLNESELDEQCSSQLDNFKQIEDRLNEIWCSTN